jgi:hypothetical protein
VFSHRILKWSNEFGPLLQKPEALTTFGRYFLKNIRRIITVIYTRPEGGHLTLAGSGQRQRLFQAKEWFDNKNHHFHKI